MSFSTDVKNEILSHEITNEDNKKAFTYGMMLFSRAFSLREISMLSENYNVAQRYYDMVSDICNVQLELSKTKSGNGKVDVIFSADRKKIMDIWGYSSKSNTARINHGNLGEEGNGVAFLSGAFLVCGTVSDPNKGYHLEFVVPYKHLAEDLLWLISNYEDIGLTAKMTKRNSNYVIYFRDSSSIENILTLMGAANSSLELMVIKMYKDKRNHVNRKLNFENANLDKTIDASSKQAKAIQKLKDNGAFDSLDSKLKELANLRIDNPEMSLSELADNLSYEISRSGVNHKLNKLCSLAEDIK